jgi:hypothetical protein
MKKLFLILITITALYTFQACTKNSTNSGTTGTIKIELDHLVNGSAMQYNKDYVNAAGETMQFTLLKYYLSNFSLIETDGSIYTLPKDECYFLIEEPSSGVNPIITLANIPNGEYKEVRFIIGVDSLKNCAPASERTGAIDPATSGMYWAWNSGYIFLKIEGSSPAILGNPGATSDKFAYHIGLFGGYSSPTVNNVKQIALSGNGETAKVSSNITPKIQITAEILEIFKTPNTMSFATTPTIHLSPTSKQVADNYIDMFKIKYIQN